MNGSAIPSLWIVVGITYLLAGAVIAWRLSARGASATTSLSALSCWPLLLPLLGAPPRTPGEGPLRSRIHRCADDLRRTMADPATDGVVMVDDLDDLVADLERADQRLGMVDALLTDVADSAADAQGLDALRRARARAAAEVEAVLDGMVELRLSIGLRSLAGNTVPVHERLQDLRARLGAVDEMAALELAAAP